jgi:CHAD domain-containing protein
MIIASKPELESKLTVAPVEVGITLDRGFTVQRQPKELPKVDGSPQANIVRLLLPRLGIHSADLAIAFELAKAIKEQRERFNQAFRRCQRGLSEKSIHDARVNCRRLIARVSLVKEAFPGSNLDSIVRSLKRFFKSLGELRDVHVQREALIVELAEYPEVIWLRTELGHRQGELVTAGTRSTKHFNLGKVNRVLQKLEADLSYPTASLAAKSTLRTIVVRALEGAYSEVRRRWDMIHISTPKSLHDLRKAYKQLRYMLESLPPSVAQPSPAQLEVMGKCQTAMGKIQDVEVLLGLVNDYNKRCPMLASRLEQFRQELIVRLRLLADHFITRSTSFLAFGPLPFAVLENGASTLAEIQR